MGHQGLVCFKALNLNATHGFFTRRGGVSANECGKNGTDLNCGLSSGDVLADILENRRRVQSRLGSSSLVSVSQVHSSCVLEVDQSALENCDFKWNKADALVTTLPGVALAVTTADCCPVLFEDVSNSVICAAHAGWRGALSGVLEASLEAMLELGADLSSIHAALGPCIQQNSYQVGCDFYRDFIVRDESYARFFIASDREEYWQFDLPAFICSRLKRKGILSVEIMDLDTLAFPDDFFSHRRGILSGRPEFMRHISTISLPERE